MGLIDDNLLSVITFFPALTGLALVATSLLAIPLGLSPRIHGRSWGLIMGLLVFLIYYVVFTASWRLAFTAHLNPALAPYLGDILFAGVALYLWWRTLKELPLVPQGWSLKKLFRFSPQKT